MDLDTVDFDYYDVLNVTRDSSAEEIKTSYHKLIRQWHPDKNLVPPSDASQAPATPADGEPSFDIPQELCRDSAFTKIQLAYTVLSDPAQRRLYDKYGSEGVQLKKLIKQQMEQDMVEASAIPEEVRDDHAVQKMWELRQAADEVEIERRIQVLLQKRRWDRFQDFPVQVVSRFTFAGVTHFFDDQVATLMRRRMFRIRETAVNSSVEVMLSKHTRAGYTHYGSATRGTFGKTRGGVYLSSELTDTLESTLSVDWGDYVSYRSGALSLKKKFSDHFWATSVFGLDRYLTPSMRCVLHKSWGERHAVELTALPDYLLTYGYNRVFAGDLKLNLQTAVSPEDVGTLVRVKALSTAGSVVGVTCRYSVLGGVSVDGYVRQRLESELLAKLKLECRVRYQRSSVFLILKLVLNNTRFDLPIELYSGDADRCVFLGTAAACALTLLPAVAEMAAKLLSPAEPEPRYGFERPRLRRSFYASFPAFSYLACRADADRRHAHYVGDQARAGALASRAAQWSEEALEALVLRELLVARQEGAALLGAAKVNYQREADVEGLCVLFAVYGHPEAVGTLAELVTMDLFDDLGGSADPASPATPPLSGRCFTFGAVTVHSILRQNNQTRLARLFDRHLLDVTNALMSRVAGSRLVISTSSKRQLIGFADPCASLVGVAPELFVCYRYRRRAYAATFEDGDPVVLPEGCDPPGH
ncbi:molecular chaperone DnaJ [Babesia caballi]|uniref:Molecular chaperone DnaJ n=1 Tax=Babesia caballi TaxID=5871 RepID=A0AAV4LPY2_BABCB|nr:molecular chaperone DnaJ [Babesia caballi]